MKKTILPFLLVFILPFYMIAQYSESFSTDNKGILSGACSTNDPSSCVSVDFVGVDWTIGGNLSGIDTEGFFTIGGALEGRDLDEVACFIAPQLDISIGGPVSLAVSFSIPSGSSWEGTTTVGSIDFADVQYSVDGGPFITIPNVNGCTTSPGNTHTISGSSCGSIAGPITFTPSASGIVGSTLDIQVCIDTNASGDIGRINSVSVPEAGVGLASAPVELVAFDLINRKEDVKLTWETASEINNKGFEIQHSQDSRKWESLGFMEGKGTSFQTNEYDFIDNRPSRGINYYRIKQIDFNGTFEYSSIRAIEWKELNGLTKYDLFVAPNPGSKFINVSLPETLMKSDQVLFEVYNQLGQLVHTERVEINGGPVELDINNLSEGFYLLSIQENNQYFSTRFVKQ